MFPYFDIFGFQLPTYGLISLVGVIVAGLVILKLAPKRGIDKSDLLSTAIVAAIGLFIGAHLLYGITRIEDVIEAFGSYKRFESFGAFLSHVLELFSGMVFYGGLYGGLFAGFLYAKKKKLPVGGVSDVFALFIPLFHVFGRIGCFFAGCCYGVESEVGITGRVITGKLREVTPRFPVQLLEAFLLLLLFFLMFFLYQKGRAKGNLIFIYLLIYAVLRFCLEFLRGDEIRGKFMMFTTSQWISIVTILWVSVFLIIRKCRKNKT